MQSRSAKVRRIDNQYASEGGMQGRFASQYRQGRTVKEIAEEFGLSYSCLRNYWVPKWRKQAETKTFE